MDSKLKARLDAWANKMAAAALEEESAETVPFDRDESFLLETLKSHLVSQIRAVMKEKEINERKLAEIINEIDGVPSISRQRVNKILKDRSNITLRTIVKFAIALDAPIALRFGEKNVRPVVQVVTRAIVQYVVSSSDRCHAVEPLTPGVSSTMRFTRRTGLDSMPTIGQ